MDDLEPANARRSSLVSRIHTSSSGQKYLTVFSVGVSREWARFSKVRAGTQALSSTWQHQVIPRPSGAPSSFLPSLSYPALTQVKENHIKVETLGFCAESSEEGEVYHVSKYVAFSLLQCVSTLDPNPHTIETNPENGTVAKSHKFALQKRPKYVQFASRGKTPTFF